MDEDLAVWNGLEPGDLVCLDGELTFRFEVLGRRWRGRFAGRFAGVVERTRDVARGTGGQLVDVLFPRAVTEDLLHALGAGYSDRVPARVEGLARGDIEGWELVGRCGERSEALSETPGAVPVWWTEVVGGNRCGRA